MFLNNNSTKVIAMRKPKVHFFKANTNIRGRYRCVRCNCEKVDKQNGKFEIIRGGMIDRTPTRMNCFKLSRGE